MTFHLVHSMRTVMVVVALAFGLAAQTFAPAAMTMQPDHGAMAGASLSRSDICPGCSGLDHSKAMIVDCSVGLCSGVAAVLLGAPLPSATHDLSFSRVAQSDGQGITIQPALGPPRPSHLA
jgi:hypothetical protein